MHINTTFLTNFFFLLFVVFSVHLPLFAQQNKADSLEKVLKTKLADTTRVNVLNQLAFAIYSINPDKSKKYAEEALSTATRLSYQKGIGYAYANIGQHYRQKGDFVKALEFLSKGLDVFEKINDWEGKGNAFITIGLINGQQSNFSEAHEYHLKSLRLYEERKDTEKIAVALSNIGYTYALQNEYNLALEYYFKSLPISKSINDTWREVLCYTNIGMAYSKKKEYDTALYYFEKSIELAKKINIPVGRTQIAMGDTYFAKKDYVLALRTLHSSLKSFEKGGNKYYISEVSNAIGKVYLINNQLDSALSFFRKGLTVAQLVGAKAFASKSYDGLSKTFAKQAQIDSAYHYQTLYASLKDSIYNEEIFRKTAFAKFAYDIDKKQNEILILQEQNRNEILIRNATIMVVILLLGGVFIIYRNSQKISKINNLLNEQNVEIKIKNEEIIVQNEELQQQQEEILAQREVIAAQNEELVQQNTKISQSILAALTIQKAILPSENRIGKLFTEYFILFRPKDVVSGDFYWVGERDTTIVLAAADCTGHGVPAAFMTMIINTLLDRLVLLMALTTPADILLELHFSLQRLLRQDETGDNNGMDVALVFIKNIAANKVHLDFAGAKNDAVVYHAATQQIEVLKADRKSIGGTQNKKKEPFNSQQREVCKGSVLYMGSDGFADQNNPNRERYSKQRLLLRFQELAPLALKKQYQILDTEMTEFMQNEPQRDDMLLLGVKL